MFLMSVLSGWLERVDPSINQYFIIMSESFDEDRSPRYLTAQEEVRIKEGGNNIILILVGLIAVLIILFASYASNYKPSIPAKVEKIEDIAHNTTDIKNETQVKKQKNQILQKIEEVNKQLREQQQNATKDKNIEAKQSTANTSFFNQSTSSISQSNISNNIISTEPKKGELGSILRHAPIWAGELHFARIPREYWEHRLQMVKALGFNALSVYIFWNYHELSRGVFDFQNGEKDLVGFLKLSQKYGFKLLLRPGPYVCAEWDFGGLPARLFGIQNLTIRASNKPYEDEVFVYFEALTKVISPFLEVNGGNIILIQIENEFGSLSGDSQHTLNLLKMWSDLGVKSNFYYQDAAKWSDKHYWPGASLGISQGHHIQQFQELENTGKFKGQLIFGGEVYTGWLTHWGETWNGLDENTFKNNFKGLVDNNKSFSLYLIHGGTNFGLTAGANDFSDRPYTAHITSYDYDAPINEQGSPTNKYHEIRRQMEKLVTITDPIPLPIPTITIPEFNLTLQASLLSNLPPGEDIQQFGFFQDDKIRMYHQGIVVYETVLRQKREYIMRILIHDFGLIYVDDEYAGNVTRTWFAPDNFTITCKRENCSVKIVVEAMGHVNYHQMQRRDRKGIIGLRIYNYTNKINWKFSRVLLNNTDILSWFKTSTKAVSPSLLMGAFQLSKVGDTYFDMKAFGKGYLWVNGHLLGRYWNIGPQQRLFCPGVWMKQGKNEVKILELSQNIHLKLSSKEFLIEQ